MKMVSIIGEYQHLDDTIDALLDCGCYHPEQAADIMSSVKGFSHISEENPYAVELKRIKEIFEYGDVKPELVPGPEKLSETEVDNFINVLDKNLTQIHDKRIELKKNIDDAEIAISQLEHFLALDIELEKVYSSKFIKVRFGRLPTESYQKLRAYRRNPYVLFFPCSSDDQFYWGMYLSPLDQEAEIDRIFASLFFERLRLPGSTGTPGEAVMYLREQLKNFKAQLQNQGEMIDNYFSNHRTECLQFYTQVKRNHDAFEIRKYATKYSNSFMLLGWVPDSGIAKFTECIGKVDGVEVEKDAPGEHDPYHPPTKLRNRKPFRPFEFFVNLYGPPNYREADPTALVAVTYTLLFGIMFADVGQGILLSITGYLMWKFKKMALGKIIIPCGIFGAIMGLVFGSVFGFEHLLDPIYHSVGFDEKPIDVMESATTLLAFSIGIGIVLIIIAMFTNVYSSLKQKNYASALFSHNGIAGIIFYCSVLAIVGSMLLELALPTTLIILLGCVLPLILMFLKDPLGKLVARRRDWKPESIGDYVLENAFELFEIIISYLTNTVSFLRVGAFVLVHSGMMMVFFALADIVGGAGGVIIIIFGNVFVTGLEGLLVGIQVLRLEFYEMFSRFYTGEGYEFNPISVKAE